MPKLNKNIPLRKQLKDEKLFLDSVYHTYRSKKSSQSRFMKDLIMRTFEPFIRQSAVGLQLGCGTGYETKKLSEKLKRLDVIDGSKKFIREARKIPLSNVNYKYALFEEFECIDIKYDYVFAHYILEHVLNIEKILQMIKSVLKPEGLLFVVVPNARALSRQLALHMGLIDDLKALTENDIAHGHRRVFDRVSLNKWLGRCGFKIISQGGILLKILADFQMDRLLDEGILEDKHMRGLYSLGLEYPDLCGSIFAICQQTGNPLSHGS